MDPNAQHPNQPFLSSDEFHQQQQQGGRFPPQGQPQGYPQLPPQNGMPQEQAKPQGGEIPGIYVQAEAGVTYGGSDLYSAYAQEEPRPQEQSPPQPQPQQPGQYGMPPQYMPPMQPQMMMGQPMMQPPMMMGQPMMMQTMMPPQQPSCPPGMNTEVRGGIPGEFWCLTCNKVMTSEVDTAIGKGTWILAIGIFAGLSCCCFCFLAPLPLCFPCTKDTVHNCPKCRRQAGRENFLIN